MELSAIMQELETTHNEYLEFAKKVGMTKNYHNTIGNGIVFYISDTFENTSLEIGDLKYTSWGNCNCIPKDATIESISILIIDAKGVLLDELKNLDKWTRKFAKEKEEKIASLKEQLKGLEDE